MTLKQSDLERLLLTTRHNRTYDVERAAKVLYQYYVRSISTATIGAHLHISYSRVISIRKDAISKLRAVWPLFSQRDMTKLHANTAMRRAIWPPPS